jgi:translocation and assembly module TamB
MKTWKRTQRVLKALGTVLVLLVIAVAAAYVFFQTRRGKDWLAGKISAAASGDSFTLRIEGIDGTLPAKPRIAIIAIGDRSGEWLSLSGIQAEFSVRRLLRGSLHVSKLEVDSLALSRLPKSEGDKVVKTSGQKFSLPAVRIDNFAVGQVAIKEDVFGKELALGLTGSLLTDSWIGELAVDIDVTGDVESPLRIAGKLHQQGPDPAFSLNISASPLRFGRINVNVASIEGRMNFKKEGLDGFARLAMERDGVKGEFSCLYALPEGKARLSEISMHAADAKVVGELEFTFAGNFLDGLLDVDIENVSQLAALLGHEVAGSVKASARFAATDEAQSVRAGWKIHGIHSALVDVRVSSGSADLMDIYGVPTGALHARLDGLQRDDMRIDSLDLSVSGNGKELVFNGSMAGYWKTAVTAAVEGVLARFDELPELHVGTATGTIAGVSFGLRTPLAVSLSSSSDRQHTTSGILGSFDWNASEVHVQPFNLSIGDGIVEGGGMYNAQNMNLSLAVSNVPIDSLPVRVATNFAGDVTATVIVRGTPGEPLIESNVSIAALRSKHGPLSEMPAVTATFKATFDGDAVRAGMEVRPEGAGTASASLVLPIQFSLLPFAFDVRREERLQYILKSELDIGLLNRLPLFSESRFSGSLLADLAYAGTWTEGETTGTCELKDVSYDDFRLGTAIRNLNAPFSPSGEDLVLEQASGTDGSGGSISAEGRVDLRPAEGIPYTFDISMNRAKLIRRNDVSATASGKVHIEGDIRNTAVSGDIKVDPALINLDNLPPGAPPVLVDTTSVAKQVESKADEKEQTDEPSALTMNLTVEFPGELFVRGSGLDSVWVGALSLTPGTEYIEIRGGIEPRRGSFNFLGRQFLLDQGSVRFDGSWPPSPTLDLEARHDRADITAIMKIRGRVDHPELSLESIPPMPEDEILSFVLFGRNLSTITPLQAVQIASAARSMRGGGGVDFMEKVRASLGVDRLEFRKQGGTEGGQAEIAAGRYMSPGLYVELSRSLGSNGGTSMIVEYEIRRNLTIETDVGAAMRPGLGVNWRKDY